MIDLHCHILPGVDDGSRSAEESLLMAKLALEDGIRTIAATPHTLDGTYLNPLHSIDQDVHSLQKALKAGGIGLRICVGADVHLCPVMADRIKTGEAATLNNIGRMLSDLRHFDDAFESLNKALQISQI